MPGAEAATINVSTSSQLASAVASANPGDLILMADGNYSGFTMKRSGNASSPITIQAATVGGAVINSGMVVITNASWINLDGLGVTTSGGSITLDGVARPAGIMLASASDCRITRCSFALSGAASGTGWVFLGDNSQSNRIDHCSFGPNSVGGHTHYIFPCGSPTISGITPPADRTPWAEGNGPNNPNMARFTVIDHNYFHDQGSGDGEAIALGAVGVCGDYQGTQSIVEYNLFVNCNGDPEIITTKSSTNTIRYNTVRTSAGVFSLRSGNGSSIYGNFFLCGGTGGGVKINEMHHKVYNNYIENSDTSNYPIMAENGDPYSSTNFAHAQVVDAEITYNTIVNPGRQVLIGHGGSTLSPSNCVFANNIISGSGTLYSEGSPAPVNMTRSQNIANGSVPGLSGFLGEDPLFTAVMENGSSLQKLSSGSPAINAGNSSYYSYVNVDMDGQSRSTSDIGADEYSTGGIIQQPLTTLDVGPSSPGGGINVYYKFVDHNSGNVAAVHGAATTNGATVILWTFGSAQNDQWQFVPTDSGYYKVVNRHSGLCMAVQGASTADSAAIVQWSFGSAQNDQWIPVDDANGYFTLYNRKSGKVLDVQGAGTSNGTPFDQYHWTGGNNQQFQFVNEP